MPIILRDDGTLDTVFRCTECNEEFRFNYDGPDGPDAYYIFIRDCIKSVKSEHECEAKDGTRS